MMEAWVGPATAAFGNKDGSLVDKVLTECCLVGSNPSRPWHTWYGVAWSSEDMPYSALSDVLPGVATNLVVSPTHTGVPPSIAVPGLRKPLPLLRAADVERAARAVLRKRHPDLAKLAADELNAASISGLDDAELVATQLAVGARYASDSGYCMFII